MKFDALAAYAEWYSKHPLIASIPNGVTRVGQFSGLILHRSDEFQTQMWICDPGSEIPDHSHPNVDSIQVLVSGEVHFRLERELLEHIPNGFMRVLPGQSHGATIGPSGGCFLTFQRWLNGVPESVEMDWEGPALDAKHGEAIKG